MNDYNTVEPRVAKKEPSQPETLRNKRIRSLYATGSYSYRKLARIYGISHKRIGEIIKGGSK